MSLDWDGYDAMTVVITGNDAELKLCFDQAQLTVERRGLGGLLDWDRRAPVALSEPTHQTINTFNDSGLIEVFVNPAGLTVTAFIPGARV